MSTSIDLSTQVYLTANTQLSGGSLIPSGPGLYFVDFILNVPELAAGETITFHITGTLAASSGIDSVLSADLAGYNDSAYYTLCGATPLLSFGPHTIDMTVGAGIEDYDAAIAAGETFAYIAVGGTSGNDPQVDSITYDVTGGSVPDAPVYTIGGVTEPAGASTITDATEVAIPSVSAGAPGETGGDFTVPYLWWKFTATQDGPLKVDAALSYGADSHVTTTTQPKVSVELFSSAVGPAATSLADLTSLGYVASDGFNEVFGVTTDCGVATTSLTAGTTYYVALSQRDESDPAALVLRVSAYAAITDWIQGDDLAWVGATDGTEGDLVNHTADAIPSEGYVVMGTRDQRFLGHYEVRQAHDGPDPFDQSDAWELSWHNARTGQGDFQYYNTPYTDPDYNGAGMEPILLDGDYLPSGSSFSDDRFVGATFGRHTGGVSLPGFATFDAFADSAKYNLTDILSVFEGNAGGGTPGDAPFEFTGDLEYEADVPELVKVEVAPDDLDNIDTASGSVVWYVKAVPPHDGSTEDWGPDSFETDGTAPSNTWSGGLAGPGSFVEVQDQALDTYSGGVADWVEIDSAVVSAAMGYDVDGATVDGFRGGLRLVSLFPEMLEDTLPFSISGTTTDYIKGRNHQWAAMRITLRPARHRWVSLPDYTPVDRGFVPPLRLTNRRDMFGSAYSGVMQSSRQGSNRITGYL